MHWIESRYTVKCAECGEAIFAGEKCYWDPESRKAYCEGNGCGKEMEEGQETTAPPRGNLVISFRPQKPPNITPCTDCYHYMGDHNERGCSKCGCLKRST